MTCTVCRDEEVLHQFLVDFSMILGFSMKNYYFQKTKYWFVGIWKKTALPKNWTSLFQLKMQHSHQYFRVRYPACLLMQHLFAAFSICAGQQQWWGCTVSPTHMVTMNNRPLYHAQCCPHCLHIQTQYRHIVALTNLWNDPATTVHFHQYINMAEINLDPLWSLLITMPMNTEKGGKIVVTQHLIIAERK